MSRTYGKAQDLIDFTRASGGTALRRVKYGAELVTNGTFDTDSDWSKQTGWSIGSGVASFSGGGGASILQNAGLESGKVYAITFDITSITSGGFIARCGFDNVSQTFSTTGTHTANLVCGSNAFIYISSVGVTAGTIDNVSVKEVTFDTSDGDLILFNHPTNVPRIEYDASGNLLGLLVEESRANILPYSEAFDSIYYGKVRGDVASESIDDPFGQQGAFSWTATDFSESYIFDDVTINSGATITFSSFIKKKTADYCHLLVWDNSASGCRVWFDLVNGQVGTDTAFGSTFVVAGSSITESANGWYRCSMTVTTSGSTVAVGRLHPSNGNGDINSSVGKSIYIYGAQLEEGSFPTSYIPTTGSTATRSADVASIATSAFGYNSSEGSVVVEGKYTGIGRSATSGVFELCQVGGSYQGIDVRIKTSDYAQSFDSVGAITSDSTSTITPSSSFKIALGFETGKTGAILTLNGSSTIGGTTVTASTVDKLEMFRHDRNTDRVLNGHLKSIKYYPRKLLQSQIEELTS